MRLVDRLAGWARGAARCRSRARGRGDPVSRTRIGALTLALGLSLCPDAAGAGAAARAGAGGCSRPRAQPVRAGLGLHGDEEGIFVQIGFPFTFYGQAVTQSGMTTNGYVTFGAAVSPYNEPIPSTFPPNGLLARSGTTSTPARARPPACSWSASGRPARACSRSSGPSWR